jgi:hypothetical protein
MSSVVISGDTSGQVTIAAPAVAGTTTLTLPATTGTVLNDATVGVCRAWVNYKGTATRAINASFNVSSVTFVSTGTYTINFTTTLSDANYAAVVGADNGTGATLWCCTSSAGATPTTSAFRVQSFNTSVTLTDAPLIQVAVFR